MADNIPEEGKGYKCKRPGCGGKFKHKTQLYRHKKPKCNALSPAKKSKKQTFVIEYEQYKCQECMKTYKFRMGYFVHKRDGKCGNKDKPIHQCIVCNTTFSYKSDLERHKVSKVN